MLSKDLEATLNLAFVEAHEKRHEFITVEHLLLALLENDSAAKVLTICSCDLRLLRAELTQFIDETISLTAADTHRETQPTLGFQRVLQRAVFHAQSSDKQEVNGADLLVALFSEQDSHAVYLLSQQDITRLDIVNYLSHGEESELAAEQIEEGVTPAQAEVESPLEKYTTNLNQEALAGTIDPLIGRGLN